MKTWLPDSWQFEVNHKRIHFWYEDFFVLFVSRRTSRTSEQAKGLRSLTKLKVDTHECDKRIPAKKRTWKREERGLGRDCVRTRPHSWAEGCGGISARSKEEWAREERKTCNINRSKGYTGTKYRQQATEHRGWLPEKRLGGFKRQINTMLVEPNFKGLRWTEARMSKWTLLFEC